MKDSARFESKAQHMLSTKIHYFPGLYLKTLNFCRTNILILTSKNWQNKKWWKMLEREHFVRAGLLCILYILNPP